MSLLLSSGLNWVFFPLQIQTTKLVCRKLGCFSRSFSLNFSGRTIEFDKVIETEQNEQSSTIPEAVLEATAMLMALVSTKCCSTGYQNIY